MTENKPKFEFSYILITSLYYPAILGAIFYFLIDCFPSIPTSGKSILLALASLAIVISFSIDFLYSYASRAFYSGVHLFFDLSIVTLLFCSYKSLINGIKNSSSISFFFLGFFLIHTIFVIWDIFFIPKSKSSLNQFKFMTIFDGVFLLVSIICYFYFSNDYRFGILYLWFFSAPYAFFCKKVVLELHQQKRGE